MYINKTLNSQYMRETELPQIMKVITTFVQVTNKVSPISSSLSSLQFISQQHRDISCTGSVISRPVHEPWDDVLIHGKTTQTYYFLINWIPNALSKDTRYKLVTTIKTYLHTKIWEKTDTIFLHLQIIFLCNNENIKSYVKPVLKHFWNHLPLSNCLNSHTH